MSTPSHILAPRHLSAVVTPRIIEGADLGEYAKYLTDESRQTGKAAAMTFPGSTAEVSGAVLAARERGWSITVSNARTGIAAGAVPAGGLLLSLERLNRIRALRPGPAGSVLVHCEAGVLLSEVQKGVRTGVFAESSRWDEASTASLAALRQGRFFYPPDPTETGAAIGGTIACNASGAHTFLYGPTRPYVQSLTLVLMDGRVLELERGRVCANRDGSFGIRQADGSVSHGRIPSYVWPRTKNAGGYYAVPGMDLVDLFVGSEGTLGIITEAAVRAIPAPETCCALMTFWPAEAAALRFTRAVRELRHELGVEAIEYFGPGALRLLRQRREQLGAVSGVPQCVPSAADCAIYLDIGTARAQLESALARVAAIVGEHGGDPESCWSALADDERERLRIFRHALPETVNARIAEVRRRHPAVTKLGTDMAVPDAFLEPVMAMYRSHLDRAGLPYVIFGHIGDNHLHVNILPEDPQQYALGKTIYRRFAEDVVAMGGSPAAEHGIGKLKTAFLEVLYGADGVSQMRAVKAVFDPDLRLGPGTLFDGGRP